MTYSLRSAFPVTSDPFRSSCPQHTTPPKGTPKAHLVRAVTSKVRCLGGGCPLHGVLAWLLGTMCGLDPHQLVDLTAQHTPEYSGGPENRPPPPPPPPQSASQSKRAGEEAAAPGSEREEVLQQSTEYRAQSTVLKPSSAAGRDTLPLALPSGRCFLASPVQGHHSGSRTAPPHAQWAGKNALWGLRH